MTDEPFSQIKRLLAAEVGDPGDVRDKIEAYTSGIRVGRQQAADAIRQNAQRYVGEQYRHFQMCALLAEGERVPPTRQDVSAPRPRAAPPERGADTWADDSIRALHALRNDVLAAAEKMQDQGKFTGSEYADVTAYVWRAFAELEQATTQQNPRNCWVCPNCLARTYNSNDIANQYCGCCHTFPENRQVCRHCGDHTNADDPAPTLCAMCAIRVLDIPPGGGTP